MRSRFGWNRILKTEYENITVYYGYLKTKPDDYWISVDGDKVAINL